MQLAPDRQRSAGVERTVDRPPFRLRAGYRRVDARTGCGSTSTGRRRSVADWPFAGQPVAGRQFAGQPFAGRPSPVRCLVSLSSTSIGVGADDSDATVAVVTDGECAWTASEAVAWIAQLSPASGQGSGEIGFQVTANASLEPRQGEIEVNGVRFQVLQAAATCTFQLSASTATLSAAGGRRRSQKTSR